MSDVHDNSSPDPIQNASGPMELVATAARDGASDARVAAAQAWAASSRFASRFVYTTCYTISYGIVFTTTYIAHAVPKENAAVRGLIDGAADARRKVETVRSQMSSGGQGSHEALAAAPA